MLGTRYFPETVNGLGEGPSAAENKLQEFVDLQSKLGMNLVQVYTVLFESAPSCVLTHFTGISL